MGNRTVIVKSDLTDGDKHGPFRESTSDDTIVDGNGTTIDTGGGGGAFVVTAASDSTNRTGTGASAGELSALELSITTTTDEWVTLSFIGCVVPTDGSDSIEVYYKINSGSWNVVALATSAQNAYNNMAWSLPIQFSAGVKAVKIGIQLAGNAGWRVQNDAIPSQFTATQIV